MPRRASRLLIAILIVASPWSAHAEPCGTGSLPTIRPALLRRVVAVGDGARWRCSGVLIDASHVLTAAHCLPATRIFVGERVDAPGEEHGVSSTVTAPESIDAALLTLVQPVSDIGPLALRMTDEPPLRLLLLAGFGARDRMGTQGYGTRHTTWLAPGGWGCDVRHRDLLGCNAEEMVLRSSDGRDTCVGDSGGPVFESIRVGDHCTMRLLAITSRSVRNSSIACGQGGIYVRVDQLATWLREHR